MTNSLNICDIPYGTLIIISIDLIPILLNSVIVTIMITLIIPEIVENKRYFMNYTFLNEGKQYVS